MSEILPEPLPPSATWGHVVGRVVKWVADTGTDTNDDPEAYPVEGKVTFRPRAPMRSIDDPAPFGSWVVQTTESFNLVDGWVVDREGRPQLALVTGVYDVVFDLVSGTIAPFPIEVTAEHTVENPLNLRTVAPWQPPTDVPTQLLPVPVGGQPGQVLQLMADGSLAWGFVAAGPDSLPLVKVQPNAAAGATVNGSLDVWRVGNTVFAQFKFVIIRGWTRWETVFIVPPGYGGTGTFVYVADSPGAAPGFYISGRNLQLVGESTGEIRGTVAWPAGELMP